jgi:hypothetical protein
MSLSIHIYGIKEADERHAHMVSIYNSCTAVKVSVPQAVYDYFEGMKPLEDGVVFALDKSAISREDPVFEVDLSLIPKDTKRIRFVLDY